ncbi:MAG: hypothetical protein DBX59_02815 [Bacillota bacterium]|nr:MAG: hypothetical protein DBX59_02815 [Bacillota bacterium]
MFKYKKAEIATYLILIFFTVLFSALLLANGYPAWFLFASAVVLAPCGAMLAVIFSKNRMLALSEKYLAEEDYEKLDALAAKKEDKYFFLKIYRIDSLLERGEGEKFAAEYAAYADKHRLAKDWLFRLEAYKAFYELLKNGEIAFRNVYRLESEIAAEEVEKERCICKILGYVVKKDYDRAVKQIGWYDRTGQSRFLGFMYDYACCLVSLAVSEDAAPSLADLKESAYNGLLKAGADRIEEVYEKTRTE